MNIFSELEFSLVRVVLSKLRSAVNYLQDLSLKVKGA